MSKRERIALLDSIERLGYLKAFADQAFTKMSNEWLVGGIGKAFGSGGKYALRNGSDWGLVWVRRLREVLKLEQQLNREDDKWWDERLGEIGVRKRPLTRRTVVIQQRPRPGGWSIPF